MRDEVIKINLCWIIVVLMLCIAALVVSLPSGNVIQAYVSFASAIASILLAIVAIFYSMISNKGIDSALAEIRTSSNEIASQTRLLNNASRGLTEEAAEALRKLTDLPSAFSQLSSDVGRRIEEISISKQLYVGDESSAHDKSDFDPSGKPLALLLSVYIMYLSYKHTKVVTLDKLSSTLSQGKILGYVQGSLDSMKYLKPCNLEIEGVGGTYLTRSLGSLQLDQFIERFGSKPIESEPLKKVLGDVFKYFDEPVNFNDEGSADGASETQVP